jgi:pimeloyl-ACP methyl ester carboxylesterase
MAGALLPVEAVRERVQSKPMRRETHVGGEVVELDEAYHWVVEDRPEAYRERLRAFLAERHT